MYEVRLLKEIALADGTHPQPGEILSGPDVYHLVANGIAEPVNDNAKRRLELDQETTRLKAIAAERRRVERATDIALEQEASLKKRNESFAKRLGVAVNTPEPQPEVVDTMDGEIEEPDYDDESL